MNERALRTIMLVQAIEESDRTGEVLPLADRAQATKDAGRDRMNVREAAGLTLSPPAEQFLVRRSERLAEYLQTRSPVLRNVMALADGISWLGRGLLVVALISGLSLSALDGSRQINILAFPLLGLILWNLAVYVYMIANWVRRHSGRLGSLPWLPVFYERIISWRAGTLLKRSSQFNAPLAEGLRRFSVAWTSIARPLLILRARRLFHLSAALVAIGLITGMYVRGVLLRYDAGWESTFLAPSHVRILLKIFYGPASALTGIALPQTDAEVEVLRWDTPDRAGDAAPWIHLIAVTALLYIVLPRLLAALVSTTSLWWMSRNLAAPSSLVPYTRTALTAVGATVQEIASVTPYAYDPPRESIEGLERQLSAGLGGSVTLDLRDPVQYGEEQTFTDRLAHGAPRVADWNVLLMNLASTPEPENHGLVISGLRDGLMRSDNSAPLLVVVDEAIYASRMAGDASFEARLEDRRRLWRDFVAGYGIKAFLTDLSRVSAEDAAQSRARQTLRACLWTAREKASIS
jgi:hypothetical protein